jgi:hypothetical protein
MMDQMLSNAWKRGFRVWDRRSRALCSRVDTNNKQGKDRTSNAFHHGQEHRHGS